MRSSLLSRSHSLKALLCCLVACSAPEAPRAPVATPPAEPAPVAGGWLFLGARAHGDWNDPRLQLAVPEWTSSAGDRLEWWMDDDEARGERAGLELVWSDGSRSLAPLVDDERGPRPVSLALDVPPGLRLAGVEAVVRGAPVGCVRFEFGGARLVSAAGGESALVPAAQGLQSLRRSGQGAAVLPAADGRERVAALPRLGPKVVVGEPWAALSLAARRSGAATDPDALCAVADGIPMRVAPLGAALPAGGERLDFAPMDGARTYDLWLCVEAPVQPFDCELVVVGREGERRNALLHVDAQAEGALPLGEGRVLLRRQLAAAYAIRGVELPQDARLRLQGLTARRLVSGFLDERFVAGWARAEVRGAAWIDEETRRALDGWARLRATGEVFLDLAEEAGTLQLLSQALLVRDPAALRTLAEQRAASLAARSGELDALQVLVCAVPARDADLAAVLESCSRHGVALHGVGAADLAALPPAARTLAQQLVADGRLRLDGLRPHGTRSPLRAAPLLRGLDEVKQAAAGLGAATELALLDEPRSAQPSLPALCGVAGVRQLLARKAASGTPGTNLVWRALDGGEVLLATPHLEVQGALTLDPGFWRAWTAAHRAEPTTALVVCELDGRKDEATFAAIERWRGCALAPRLVSGPLDSALAALPRVVAQQEAAIARLAADGGARGLRAAERAVAEAELVAGLAAQHGARAQLEPAARLWRRFQPAAGDAAALRGDALAVRNAAFEDYARLVDTQGAGVPVVALNTLPFPRSALLEFAGAVVLADAEGRPLPLQRGRDGGTLARVELPALGHAVVRVSPAAEAPAQDRADVRGVLDNGRVRAKLSRTGALESFVDLATGRELLQAPLVLADDGVWSLVESGPLRTTLLLRQATAAGEARIELSLAADEPALRLVCDLPASRRLACTLPGQFRVLQAGSDLGLPADVARTAAGAAFEGWISAGDGAAGLALATRDAEFALLPRRPSVDGAPAAQGLLVELPAGRCELALVAHSGGARKAGLPQWCEELLTKPLVRAVPAKKSGVPARLGGLALRRGSATGRDAQLLAPLVRAVGDGAGLELVLVETGAAAGETEVRPLLPHRELLRVDAAGAALETPAVRDGAWPIVWRAGGIERLRIVR